MEMLLEGGPSVQKYGVGDAPRRIRANAYKAAADKLSDPEERQIVQALAQAIASGEAKEAVILYGKLSSKTKKKLSKLKN